jgi:hypothetical protein
MISLPLRNYKELGWESLAERRKRRKLQMFYNIQNNNALVYLCDLIPPSIQNTTVYPLRNGSDIIMPFCLSIFYLLKCAKRIRHKLNKLMKSSPIYNKLQH